jgi:hypothetical protein
VLISEVGDADIGNLHWVELANDGGAPADLSEYELLFSVNEGAFVTLSLPAGTLGAGEVLLIVNSYSDYDTYSTNQGWSAGSAPAGHEDSGVSTNGDRDRFELWHLGTLVDAHGDPTISDQYKGACELRDLGVGPTPVYDASEWTYAAPPSSSCTPGLR